MNTIKLYLPFLAFAFLLIASCTKNEPSKSAPTTTPSIDQGQSSVIDKESAANALQVAKSLDDFKTLVVAIEAAGVEDAVVNAGPLTIFAPVNSAFDKLPAGTVASLLKPENKGKLAYILTNHVAPSNYPEKQLRKDAKKGRKLYMASGKYLTVEDRKDGLYVGGTKILKTVQVSNGWIHVIDTILVPAD